MHACIYVHTYLHTHTLSHTILSQLGMDGQFAWVNGLNGSITETIGDDDDVILAGFGATYQNGGGATKDLMEVAVPTRPKYICEQQ